MIPIFIIFAALVIADRILIHSKLKTQTKIIGLTIKNVEIAIKNADLFLSNSRSFLDLAEKQDVRINEIFKQIAKIERR